MHPRDLQTLGSQPIMPKNLHDHWTQDCAKHCSTEWCPPSLGWFCEYIRGENEYFYFLHSIQPLVDTSLVLENAKEGVGNSRFRLFQGTPSHTYRDGSKHLLLTSTWLIAHKFQFCSQLVSVIWSHLPWQLSLIVQPQSLIYCSISSHAMRRMLLVVNQSWRNSTISPELLLVLLVAYLWPLTLTTTLVTIENKRFAQ